MDRSAEVKKIFRNLTEVGPDGLKLANALFHGFAGIARGVDGHACTAYLADLTERGVLRIRNNSWVYLDGQGRLIVAGLSGDKVVKGVAKVGVLLHRSPNAQTLDQFEIATGLANSARRVAFELEWCDKFISIPSASLLRQNS